MVFEQEILAASHWVRQPMTQRGVISGIVNEIGCFLLNTNEYKSELGNDGFFFFGYMIVAYCAPQRAQSTII